MTKHGRKMAKAETADVSLTGLAGGTLSAGAGTPAISLAELADSAPERFTQLIRAAESLFRTAHARGLIPDRDFNEMMDLAEVAGPADEWGRKAATRLIGSAHNMLSMMAATMAAELGQESPLNEGGPAATSGRKP